MIGRLLWLGAGAAAGYWALRRIGAAGSPSDVAAKAANAAGSAASAQVERRARGMLGQVQEFMTEVREYAAEREAELRAALAEDVVTYDGRPSPADDDLPYR